MTGSWERTVEYPPDTPVATVGADLTRDIPWAKRTPFALRDDDAGEFLDEARSIGEQLQPGANVVLTPKTHLG